MRIKTKITDRYSLQKALLLYLTNKFLLSRHYPPLVASAESATESKCLVAGCSCLVHHGAHINGSGIINNDGTIYINDIGYIKNYLNSFLYIEELQKFKVEENYRDSLELEPDASPAGNGGAAAAGHDKARDCNPDKKAVLHVSPSSPCKLSSGHQPLSHANNAINGVYDSKAAMSGKQPCADHSANNGINF